MHPMSLYEMGKSSGNISLKDLCEDKLIPKMTGEVNLKDLIDYIVRGGWPSNMDTPIKDAMTLPMQYVDAIIDDDVYRLDGVKRNKSKMKMLLRSLARNESTTATNASLAKDIKEKDDAEIDKTSVSEYLDIFNRLFLIDNQAPFATKIRSSVRIKQAEKRHFCDPSIACALLNASPDKLLNDLETLGLLFEALVERDLRIYSNYNEGELRHFRNNQSGLEVDSIVINEDGEYGAFEIKLGANQIEEAKANLLKFYNKVDKKPKFMCIICGLWNNVVRDSETGIYILPITSLRP